jgi:hypothetical protein
MCRIAGDRPRKNQQVVLKSKGMNQRPRLLVGLAFLYLVSPFLYPVFVSLYFETPFFEVLKQSTYGNSAWRNFEIFILPIVLAGFIYFARRIGYFAVILGSLFLGVRSVIEFQASNENAPVALLLFGNLVFLFSVAYFLRKNTRAIYFDPKVRWWETESRYLVDLSGRITRLDQTPVQSKLLNIALGGAALQTSEKSFLPHEKILIEFDYAGTEYKYTAGVVWQRPESEGLQTIGVKWIAEEGKPDRPGMRKLVRDLKVNKTPTVGELPGWWEELKGLFSQT